MSFIIRSRIRKTTVWQHASTQCYTRPFTASLYLPQGDTTAKVEDTTTHSSTPPTTSAVFEDASEDYKNVLAHYPPAPPTVAQLLEQTQPSVLPKYVADGTSIFEDASQDYERLTRVKSVRKTSLETLHSLIAENRILAASSLLQDMRNLETPIPRSPVFHDAALSVLRSHMPMEVKIEHFTRFFSLIPRAHDTSHRLDFTELRRILQQGTVNLSLLEWVALTLASKGFGNGALKQFLPPLFIYLPPRRLEPFLLNLDRRTSVYWRNSRGKQRETYVKENVRGLAVRCLVYANRLDEAIHLLPKVTKPYGYTLNTFDVLLKALNSKNKYLEVIPQVEALREARKKLEIARGIVSKVASPVAVDDCLPAPPPKDCLAQVLRYICSYLNHPDPHHLMSRVLFSFLNNYNTLTGGRVYAPRLLLSRALRTSHRATKRVVWAEMQFYRSCDRPDMVVRTFMEHFFPSGVPRSRVLGVYEEVLRGRYGEPVSRITGFDENSVLARGKQWPDLEQCAMVWEALLVLAVRDVDVTLDSAHAIQDLYEELVALARSGLKHPPPSRTLPTREQMRKRRKRMMHHPTRFGSPVLPTTFHIFMHHGMRHLGPHWCQRVIEDMSSFGLWPGIFHWSTLARSWAECGEDKRRERFSQVFRKEDIWTKESVERVWRIVDAVENGSIVDWAIWRRRDSTTPVPSSPRTHLHMQPDIAFYVNVMHGFLYAKDADNADAVAVRLVRRFGASKAASDPSVSRAIKKLEDLKDLLQRKLYGSVEPGHSFIGRER